MNYIVTLIIIATICTVSQCSAFISHPKYGYSTELLTENNYKPGRNAGISPVRIDKVGSLFRPFSMYYFEDTSLVYISDMYSSQIYYVNVNSGVVTNLTSQVLCNPINIGYDGEDNILLTSEGCIINDEGFISVELKKGWATRLPYKQNPYSTQSIPYGLAVDYNNQITPVMYITDWSLHTLSIYNQINGLYN